MSQTGGLAPMSVGDPCRSRSNNQADKHRDEEINKQWCLERGGKVPIDERIHHKADGLTVRDRKGCYDAANQEKKENFKEALHRFYAKTIARCAGNQDAFAAVFLRPFGLTATSPAGL